MVRVIAALLGLLLAGCTSNIPKAVSQAPPGSPTVAQVRAEPERFAGQTVRWGGTIAEVQNRRDETRVQVVARELDDDGRPRTNDRSEGRFIARFSGFIDPAIFTEGRRLTVAGTVTGSEQTSIGEHLYRAPLIEVGEYLLWPPEREVRYGPRYYDPFWFHDPWYPYYGYPFHHPFYW